MGKVSEGSWARPTGQRSRHVGYVKFNLHPHKNRKVYISLAFSWFKSNNGETARRSLKTTHQLPVVKDEIKLRKFFNNTLVYKALT